MRRGLFVVAAVLCALTAIYHLVGIFIPVNEAPPWRHALFAAVNVVCAYGVLRRPRWFVYAFAVLLAQQLYSHGLQLYFVWRDAHRIDWPSVFVLIAMPLGMGCLIADRRSRGRQPSA